MATTTTTPPPDSTPPPLTRAQRRRGGDSPRKPMAAGHVILVGLIAFLIGGLLNAAGIRRTALSQPVGWRRDVARFFAEPLYDLSHLVHADEARRGLQDIAGRSGDDDIDLSLPSPTTTTVPTNGPTTTTTLPPREAFSPEKRLRMWVGGDSLAETPGQSLIGAAGLLGVIDVPARGVDTHVATGLARPEVFNWPAHLIEVRDTQHPDAFVLTLGPNDDQDLTGEGGGQSFGSPEWIEEYKRRVGGLMDSVTADKKHKLFLIGAPVIENVQRADTRYRIINDVYRTEAAKRKGLVEYIDIYSMFVPPGGGYSAYKTNDDGALVKVRVDDGIHFTREGGDLIAAKVLKELNRVYDLTSWQKSLPSTTTSTTTTPASTTTKAG